MSPGANLWDKTTPVDVEDMSPGSNKEELGDKSCVNVENMSCAKNDEFVKAFAPGDIDNRAHSTKNEELEKMPAFVDVVNMSLSAGDEELVQNVSVIVDIEKISSSDLAVPKYKTIKNLGKSTNKRKTKAKQSQKTSKPYSDSTTFLFETTTKKLTMVT